VVARHCYRWTTHYEAVSGCVSRETELEGMGHSYMMLENFFAVAVPRSNVKAEFQLLGEPGLMLQLGFEETNTHGLSALYFFRP
jgi:hypothetical protein